MRNIHLVFLLPLVAGCAAALNVPTLTAAHPASPEAKEAPLAKASETLSLQPSRVAAGESPLPREHTMQGHTMEGHGAHAGHDMGRGSHAHHHGGDDAQ